MDRVAESEQPAVNPESAASAINEGTTNEENPTIPKPTEEIADGSLAETPKVEERRAEQDNFYSSPELSAQYPQQEGAGNRRNTILNEARSVHDIHDRNNSELLEQAKPEVKGVDFATRGTVDDLIAYISGEPNPPPSIDELIATEGKVEGIPETTIMPADTPKPDLVTAIPEPEVANPVPEPKSEIAKNEDSRGNTTQEPAKPEVVAENEIARESATNTTEPSLPAANYKPVILSGDKTPPPIMLKDPTKLGEENNSQSSRGSNSVDENMVRALEEAENLKGQLAKIALDEDDTLPGEIVKNANNEKVTNSPTPSPSQSYA